MLLLPAYSELWCCVQVAALMAVLKAARALGLVNALDEVRSCGFAILSLEIIASQVVAKCCRTCRTELHLSLHACAALPALQRQPWQSVLQACRAVSATPAAKDPANI